ncbi:hypothetical protein [Paractinoplanes maris]|uniref:hypothetical protein n=1 Tax=Paractinoplanes maris TaxID=1734446 RepID=UPI002021D471|nr:hypothetical protein [Actinoplanes maris]
MTLERRYRRLLLAYPGPYRRGHGAEIVTTLLEMAAPGQTRPAASDAWHLFLSGLRQRFRLPSGRPLVLIAAVLITLVTGAFGAAAGSWAAEQTFTDLPGDAGVEALTRQVAGGGAEFGSDRAASPWWTTMVHAGVDEPSYTPEAAQARLTAHGWQVTAIQPRSGTSATFDPATGATVSEAVRSSAFEATRDGLRLQATGYVRAGHGVVNVQLWPADTGAVAPLMIAGAVLGLLAGWLLTAAGAYRLRPLPTSRRRVVATLTTLALGALAVPAFALWVNVWRVLEHREMPIFTVHSALSAGPYWSYGTTWLLPQLAAAGLLLSLIAWAVTLRRPPPTPVEA